MPTQEVLNLFRRQPFEPFRIYVSDGKIYEISHPELVLPGLASAVIGIPTDPAHPDLYGQTEIVTLRHVTRLEPLPQQSSS